MEKMSINLTNNNRVIYINNWDHDSPHEPPQNELEGSDISQNTLYSHHTDILKDSDRLRNYIIFTNIFQIAKRCIK